MRRTAGRAGPRSGPAYDTTLFFQDLLNPEKGAGQVPEDAGPKVTDTMLLRSKSADRAVG